MDEQRHLRYFSGTPTFYQNYLAMSNTADVAGASPSLSISGINAFRPLVAFYDIHERKREVVFFYFVFTNSSITNVCVKSLYFTFVNEITKFFFALLLQNLLTTFPFTKAPYNY
jgi:hypothetical protein